MFTTIFFLFLTLNVLHYSHSLQSGYTCESSIILKCSESKTIIILEVIYSKECNNGTSIYAPSPCIGYYRERISTQCNGQETCIIDNSFEQRPSFLIGKQANCAFKGQSINIEYSCIPDLNSNELPQIDICSSESLEDMKEGFIHTPNYPNNYPDSLTCTKTIPAPDAGHRLKIYVLGFDIKAVSRSTSLTSWLEINNNGEKFYGKQPPYTLLFDDVIEASLMFKSDLTKKKRSFNGFLLYFIVTSSRRSRPPPTPKFIATTTLEVISDNDFKSVIQQQAAGLLIDNPRQNNTGLILLVILLSTTLFIIICAFLLYKRRNDRRIRYVTETFNSFISKKSKPVTLHSSNNSDEMKLNSKLNFSSINNEDKLLSKYIKETFQDSDHIYSEDPLEKNYYLQKKDDNSILYECIDYETLEQQTNNNTKSNEKNIV